MHLASRIVTRLALVAAAVLLCGAANVSRYIDYLDTHDRSRPHPHPLDEAACRDCPGADAYAQGAALLGAPVNGSDCAGAVPYFLDAAQMGNVAAARGLGFCYWFGEGVPHVRDEAIRWYTVPARAGEPESMFRLGGLLAEKARGMSGSDPVLIAQAQAWWEKAGEAGHADALYSLAELKRDPKERIALMQRAADRGLLDAQYLVARAYLEGNGVEQDAQRGRRLLEQVEAQARKAGYRFLRSEAQSYMACTLAQPWQPPPKRPLTKAETERFARTDCESLHHGLGVARDDVAALRCYEAEDDEVQLAIMYANGYGTAPDLDAALHYACTGGAGAPAEHEALVGLIVAARNGDAVAPFDFCAIATSGYSDALCADLSARKSAEADDEALQKITATLSAPGRAAYLRLKSAADDFLELKTAAEAPPAAGAHRAARLIETRTGNRQSFVDDVRALVGRTWPRVEPAVLADADRALNAAYRAALERCPRQDDDAWPREFMCDDVRAQQRAWIRYRDRYAAFAGSAAARGSVALDVERAARLEITKRQTKWLEAVE